MAFGGPSRICIGQNIARLTLLHATSKLFRECPDIKLSHETTDKSMTPVDYFAIRPKGEKCVIVPG
jgi:cytochrome P450